MLSECIVNWSATCFRGLVIAKLRRSSPWSYWLEGVQNFV